MGRPAVIAIVLMSVLVAAGCAEPPPPRVSTPPTSVPSRVLADDGPDNNVYLQHPFDEAPPRPPRVATPKLRAFGFDTRTFPAVDGSTSTQWLGDLIAVRALGISDADWQPYNFYRNINALDQLSGGIELESGQRLSVEEQIEILQFFHKRTHSQTSEAYKALIDGKTVLLLIARGPTADELKAARDKRVELVLEPVALDALVFVVNPKNPIAGLSLEQVRSVFGGKVTRWSQLGATGALADLPVRAYVRESGSGSEELMRGLVMKGRPMIDLKDYRIPTMRGLINHVASEPDAIGYTVFYYQQFMSDRSRTRVIPIDGVAPDTATIAARRYPVTCEVFMVTRKGLPQQSAAGKLRSWLLSDEGQAVVRESGYVPIR
jgi:phosphate transport system substrate-binding protein